jgi:hypothetical protein
MISMAKGKAGKTTLNARMHRARRGDTLFI